MKLLKIAIEDIFVAGILSLKFSDERRKKWYINSNVNIKVVTSKDCTL